MIARNKRIIYLRDGTKLNLSDMELQEWIDNRSYGAIYIESRATELLVKAIKKGIWSLRLVNEIGFDHFMAWFIWGLVNKYVPYAGDNETFHRDDWWNLPSETVDWILKPLYEKQLVKMKGADCEDTSILLSSGLERLKIYRPNDKKNYYFMCIGYYSYNKTLYGHGFPIWRDRYWSNAFHKPYWLVLESTLDTMVNPQFGIPFNSNQYVIALAYNRDGHVLRMDDKNDRKILGLSDEWYSEYKDAIKDMIEYVTVGKKLEVSWMHKIARPVKSKFDKIKFEVDE